jgi:phosphate-selective porin OprO/OprP
MADYRFSDALRVRMGYHKVPFSLDDQTSENYNLFVEHPIGTTAFVPGRGVGASVLAHGNRWFTQVGVYGEGENDARDGSNDENLTIGGRFVFAPLLEQSQYVHLGAAIYRTTYAGPPTLRLRERPARHLAPYVIDTQVIDADALTAYGVEAAWARGPVGVAAEAVQARISGAGNDLDYGGYDIEAWWTLTGEFRPYKLNGGTFDRLIPTRAAGDGGWGAWQLAVRTSHLDLNDTALSAGDLTTHSLALNWYWDSRARLMFELDRSEVGLPAGSYWQTAYGMRVQVDW